jgi:hypothetical protein
VTKVQDARILQQVLGKIVEGKNQCIVVQTGDIYIGQEGDLMEKMLETMKEKNKMVTLKLMAVKTALKIMGNKKGAAEFLGISYRTLTHIMQGIEGEEGQLRLEGGEEYHTDRREGRIERDGGPDT